MMSQLRSRKHARFDTLAGTTFDRSSTIILCFNMPGKWIVLLVTYDILEAEMIKDLLESGEIETVIRSSKVTPYPVNLGKMGEVKVLVREEDRETAEELLKESGTEIPDTE
jgi:hypothetical protein